MIKVSDDLKKQLKDNDKRIRTWATWKLKSVDRFGKTIWERMSKHDQDFNLVWCEIQANLFDLSLPKLKRILSIIQESQ